MIDITNIVSEFEGEALWLEITVFSDKDTDILSEINVFLSDNEDEQSVSLNQKLSLGDNVIDFMFPLIPKPWYPLGCGPLNVYEIYAEAKIGDEIADYKTFVGYTDIDYREMSFFDKYPQLFGVSLNLVSLSQIEVLAKAGINTIYTNDRRKEVVDFSTLKGIFLMPFEAPNCSIEKTEKYRKENRKIIYDYNVFSQPFLIKKYLKPIYVGYDFISNNTSDYLYATLKQGVLDPEYNEIKVFKEENIKLNEFSRFKYEPINNNDSNLIEFACLYSGENIIGKYLIIGEDENINPGNILLSKFKISESVWKIIFTSNEFVPNLHIDTYHNITDNDFSIFPGETVQVTFSGITDEPKFKLTRH